MITETRKSFSGLRVGALESRMRAEMERLIQNLGGVSFVAPSMQEVPVEENHDALALWDKLKAGQIDMLILFTGVGTRTLLKTFRLKASDQEISDIFSKIVVFARGPKPVRALSENNLKAHLTAPEPNTWREILKTLDAQKDVKGLNVAVLEYGETHRLFLAELVARGANVTAIPVYRAALPENTQPLKEWVHKTIKGELDVLLFTNATQVEHAFAIARQDGNARELRKALASTVIASVGPTCTAMLNSYGVEVDIEPERPMMGALVAAAAEKSAEALVRKKAHKGAIDFTGAAVSASEDVLQQCLFMKACRREVTERTPVWLMRQAGRYMKEYRELRAKISFLELCKNSDLSAEVTVDAAHRLGVDAAIIFSDLLPLVEPLGFSLSYGKDQGPEIANPFRSKDDLSRMQAVDVEESMRFVFDAIRKTRKALKPHIPLIGFAGAPFTMASYIVEGKGSKNFIKTKKLMVDDTPTWNALLAKITDATIDYLNAQIAAGAQAVQLFDSWVGCLSPEDFRQYVFPHTKRLIKAIRPGVPVISFGTQTGGLLPMFKEAGGDVIGVDWRIELDEAWDILGDVAIMGNLDPVVLFSNPKEIRSRVQRILNQAAGRPGHIFNLGHGILPETPIDNVFSLIESVRELSARR